MKKVRHWMLLLLILKLGVVKAQDPMVHGRIMEFETADPLPAAKVFIEDTAIETYSLEDGNFTFLGQKLPLGEWVLTFEKEGYQSKRLKVLLQPGEEVLLDPVLMEYDWQGVDSQLGVISLTEEEIFDSDFEVASLPGVLSSSKGVFESAAAFDFSAAFFRPKGLGNSYDQLFINGLAMRDAETEGPLWTLTGGLNDVQRNREVSRGMGIHSSGFSGVGSTTYFTMNAANFRKGGAVSYALSNRSYRSRWMASYHSGKTPSGWAYSFMLSKRLGREGYVEGTPYDASSFFLSVERTIKSESSVNLTAFYTPIFRGRSTPLTEEVRELKGDTYNPNWGYQNNRIRNSRLRVIRQPVFLLSCLTVLGESLRWDNHLGYSFGKESDSRLDNAGIRNPFPHYYQRLPSYFLRKESLSVYDYQQAYWAREQFQEDGQLNWENLYQTNAQSHDPWAKYVLMDAVTEKNQIQFKSTLSSDKRIGFYWYTSIDYTRYRSNNYAQIKDLLGPYPFLDRDSFYQGGEDGFAQSNTLEPDRAVFEGDRYKYHYRLGSDVFEASFQGGMPIAKMELYLGAKARYSTYSREGFYRNGYFQDGNRSFGMSEAIPFFSYAMKFGVSYRWNGRHESNAHCWLGTQPPVLRNVFENVQQNNDVIHDLQSEGLISGSLGYRFTGQKVQIQGNVYYMRMVDATDIGFFFTENALGSENSSAFVKEIVQGLNKTNKGLELGFKWEIHPSVALKSAMAWGRFIYSDNPTLYLAGDDFDDEIGDGFVEGNDLRSRGKRQVFLKNFHQAVGPERAVQLGVEYKDPNYWWMGITANYMSHSYVDPSSLRRSEDFIADVDGLPYANIDAAKVKGLLRQERLNDALMMNLVGGKSWRLHDYYLGIFVSVSNLLNESFKTGGFEDSRYASYPQQLEEQSRPGGPLFGNRYFLGYGTTYFMSISVRF